MAAPKAFLDPDPDPDIDPDTLLPWFESDRKVVLIPHFGGSTITMAFVAEMGSMAYTRNPFLSQSHEDTEELFQRPMFAWNGQRIH